MEGRLFLLVSLHHQDVQRHVRCDEDASKGGKGSEMHIEKIGLEVSRQGFQHVGCYSASDHPQVPQQEEYKGRQQGYAVMAVLHGSKRDEDHKRYEKDSA